MATDATGTPTALGIPKFNTSVDAPSGLGGNAQMDSIDGLIQAHTSFQTSGIVILGNKLLSADANTAFSLFGNGQQKWGPGGATALDTTLLRVGVNRLGTTGDFVVDNGSTGTALFIGGALDTSLVRTGAAVMKMNGTFNVQTGYQINGTSIYASPALTGTPTAPTQLDTDNSTAIATTAWVRTRISAGSVSSVFTRTGAIVATSGDYTAAQVTNAFDKASASLQTGAGGYVSTHTSNGIGYATGAGGTVTQATSLSTGVTINSPTGQITTFTSALAGSTFFSFTVTNSSIAAADMVAVSWKTTTWGVQVPIWVSSVAAGSFAITYYNPGSLSASGAGVINFAILKGATS